ncbi:MAG: hypothetical protein GXP48_05865 [Acidobacteria bacterium]|nr:hypothetical protein [Acidobacteriota bacterium]
MQRRAATELELDRVLALVASFARSEAGRSLIRHVDALPTPGEGVLSARLTIEVQAMLAEKGTLSFAGLDDAAPWLDPAAPPPQSIEELMALLALARRVASVRRTLLALPGELELLHDLGERLPDTQGLVGWASARLGRDGRIPDSASPQLASLRRQSARARHEILQRLEVIRRSSAGAVTDAPPTLRRDRYCLPVRRAARSEVRGLVLSSSGSGATLYVEPYDIVELNNDLADAVAREQEEVQRILGEVASAFASRREELAAAAGVLARLDAAQAKALFGRIVEGHVAVPGEASELILVNARHPLLDERLRLLRREVLGEPEDRAAHPAVPLDFRLPEGVRTLLISGPNAGGKTVVLKTVGLFVLMAFSGIPLPADPGTGIPAFDALETHIGDEQDVGADLSTFSGTMSAFAGILATADPGTLVILDELGAGTDPLEGAALGFAVLEELTVRGALTIASTHLASIAMNASAATGMENAAMEFDEGAGRPTYRLHIGRPGRSHGLEIAASVGVPLAVIARAQELLGGQHLELEHWLKRLERLEGELLDHKSRLARRERELEDRHRALAAQREKLSAQRARLREELDAERETLRRRARMQLDAVLAEIERAEKERRHLGRKRREQLRAQAAALGAPERRQPEAGPPGLQPGDTVRVGLLGGTGAVRQVRGSRVEVSVGDKRLWVDAGDVARVALGVTAPEARQVRVDVDVDESIPGEIHLRGMDVESAREELERYLDRAFAAGKAEVRIVHGHGTGRLRAMVREVCSTHPAVRSFSHPPQARGGTGATEVRLKGIEDG